MPESRHGVTSYWERSQWPLQSLYFLAPLLLLYELGTVLMAAEGAARLPAIYAEELLGRFFRAVGITTVHLPAILVVVVLVVQHLVRRDPARPELKLYPLMLCESIVFALPLFVLSTMAAGSQALVAGGAGAGGGAAAAPVAAALAQVGLSGEPIESVLTRSWGAGLTFALGAGIYEELLFRMIAIAGLHAVAKSILALPPRVCDWLAVILAALLFAAYHFSSPEDFSLPLFTFYALAGVYLGVIYITRGFGIVVAVHALYDVLAIATHLRV